jgi:hypothetical protein
LPLAALQEDGNAERQSGRLAPRDAGADWVLFVNQHKPEA